MQTADMHQTIYSYLPVVAQGTSVDSLSLAVYAHLYTSFRENHAVVQPKLEWPDHMYTMHIVSNASDGLVHYNR